MPTRFATFSFALFFLACQSNESDTVHTATADASPTVHVELADSTLQQELEQIGVEDQTLRLMLPCATEQFGAGSIEYKYLWRLINEQDSINITRTVEIIENYGWLGKSRIGAEANQALWLVIQHADLELQEKYLPLLKESVRAGESEGWHQAYLEDRILMYNKENQIYGTQAVWDPEINQMKIHPIENVNEVNERRAAMGLEPIEVYAETNGYVFDQE